MTNSELAWEVLNTLKRLGVLEVIVCAGARNMPLVHQLQFFNFQTCSYFEERSVGFYALGRSRSSNSPVAVVVTSGTAVAELLPAVIEAWYQQIPIVIVSADRPKTYRGSGAPQAIEQSALFQNYVSAQVDWDVFSDLVLPISKISAPAHINVCFDEPLLEESIPLDKGGDRISKAKFEPLKSSDSSLVKFTVKESSVSSPVALVGELSVEDRSAVKEWLVRHKTPHYAEALSGLQNAPELVPWQIQDGDRQFGEALRGGVATTVLRFGGVPTLRLWRDLEGELAHIPVLSYSRRPFSGLSRSQVVYPLSSLESLIVQGQVELERSQDLEVHQRHQQVLQKYSLSEQAFMSGLVNNVVNENVYIGNSLPIRIWDMVYRRWLENLNSYGNRGANGIDGQIATYLGWSRDFSESWCILGDLTTLYDLSSLGLSESASGKQRIVIMNNGGGQIFERILGRSPFLNSQKVDFSKWAEMWGWTYRNVTDTKELVLLKDRQEKKLIVEIKVDNDHSKAVWKEWS
jgi:2-succinyl-5-enolpyruvyl-6-hydroxy-3-cyclohexene-1-carboxylate synthase